MSGFIIFQVYHLVDYVTRSIESDYTRITELLGTGKKIKIKKRLMY